MPRVSPPHDPIVVATDGLWACPCRACTALDWEASLDEPDMRGVSLAEFRRLGFPGWYGEPRQQ